MSGFIINNRYWRVIFVEPNSSYLIDRTGSYCLATTDPSLNTIFVSELLFLNEVSAKKNTKYGLRLETVLLHELGHCVMISYGLVDDIRRMVRPEYWIEMEEWVCNFIADYGYEIFKIANNILGKEDWVVIPKTLNKTA